MLVMATVIVVVLGVGVTAAVAHSVGGTSPQPPVAAVPSDGARQPLSSPEEVVRALLQAEQAGDHEASFHFLSTASLRAYSDSEAWGRHRSELPDVTAFSVKSVTGNVVVTSVSHTPRLDPFVGLSAARDTQRWRVVQEGGGWLVDANPDITQELPADGPASAAALEWAKAVQACDKNRAVSLQVETDLLGTLDGPLGLCKTTVQLHASSPTVVQPGPGTADLVAQYGNAALTWARAVTITGAGEPFNVVLAPIGSNWRVLGTASA